MEIACDLPPPTGYPDCARISVLWALEILVCRVRTATSRLFKYKEHSLIGIFHRIILEIVQVNRARDHNRLRRSDLIRQCL